MYAYKGKSSTSCPSPQEWEAAFGDANLPHEQIYQELCGYLDKTHLCFSLSRQLSTEKWLCRRTTD